jgi:hypothetical protein
MNTTTEHASLFNTHMMNKVQARAIDVAALADSGCDAATLSLAISDLRELVSEFAAAARDCRKATVAPTAATLRLQY